MRRGLCTDDERAGCRTEFGKNLDWACGHCPKRPFEDLHPYTHKLFRVLSLMRAGFPYRKNDLTLEEWMDIGRLKAVLEEANEPGNRGDPVRDERG